MRTWRDVVSVYGWRTGVLERAEKTEATMTATAKIRGVFQDRFSSPKAFLDYIGEKLHQYHKIQKDEIKNIDSRIKALKELSELANKYLSTFNVSKEAAEARSVEKHKVWNRFTEGGPQQETVDRNVLSLARRSLRKAGYLRMLKEYYSKGGAGYQFRNPKALLDYVKHPQEKTGEFVGLSPGVRLEQLDPVHRGDYEVDDDLSITCGAAFHQWAGGGADKPFFLWLENHAVCIEDDKGKLETNSVAYVRADHREQADARSKLAVLIIGNPIMAVDLTSGEMPTKMCDTVAGGYAAERRKDPRGDRTFGNGVAAFVWTEPGEVFIANHMAQEFHHSSFVSGTRVRCGGMLVVENGVVTALSNNSGHYKPRKEHVRNFVWLLQGAGAISSTAALEVHMGNKKMWTGGPGDFLRNFGQLENLAVTPNG